MYKFGVGSRLVPVDIDNPVYESSAEQNHTDFALRCAHYLGNWDIGLCVFTGTSREPRFTLNSTGTNLLPVYEQINQFGTDIQYTAGA